VFNSSFEKYGEDKAFKIAWASVKKKYARKENKWILKSSQVIPKKYHCKSALSEATAYYADIIFGDVKEDLDGDEVSYNSLCVKLNGMEADLEHAVMFGRDDIPHDTLFKVIDTIFDGTNLIGTVKFETEHPCFEDAWNFCLEGEFGASLEYTDDWEITGVTGTIVGRNPRSKVINAYKK